MNLLNLHPDIQEHLLLRVSIPLTEHQIRSLTAQVDWPAQMRLWSRLSVAQTQ